MTARAGWRDSDLWHGFVASKLTVAAAIVTAVLVFGALFADVIAPQNPFDPRSLSLMDGLTPPAWSAGGDPRFLLGTDDQGRDLLSAILYGSRLSLLVGAASLALAMALGVGLGLLAGYLGGIVDAAIMRVAEVQLTFPAILIALLISGVARALLPPEDHGRIAIPVLILSIGLSTWVQFARTVRGSAMVERGKEYVQAARVTGLKPGRIMVRHVLPNVLNPVLVIATISLGNAVLTEATLSFLGVGAPPTEPSLGTLISRGSAYLLSGEWWIVLFPALTLSVLVLAVNLLGDWLRDALNPRLR